MDDQLERNFGMRLSEQLYMEITREAIRTRRSRSNLVNMILQDYFDGRLVKVQEPHRDAV